jgi:cytochrome b involved in lipid metabolism
MSEKYTVADVGAHKDEASGIWIIVENDVYDVTSKCPSSLWHTNPPTPASTPKLLCACCPQGRSTDQPSLLPAEFLEEHPGGAKILKRFGGKNATKPFWKYHNESVLKKYGAKLKIGTVAESAKL